MKKGLLFLFLIWSNIIVFAQETQQGSPTYFYGNIFDDNSVHSLTYRDAVSGHESISVSTTTALNGTGSLRSVNRTTPYSNALSVQGLPNNTDIGDGSRWEFDFLYKYTTNGSDIVDFNTGGVASGKGGWRYWVAANSTTPSTSSGLGIYFYQSNNTLYLESKESSSYTRDVCSYTLSPNTTYIIKLIIISGKYRLYVDEYSSYSTTTTLRGSLNFGGGLTTYKYSVLEMDERRTSYNFQFDDIKAYKQSISITADATMNASSNGITNSDIAEGQKGVIAFGFAVTSTGYYNLTQMEVALQGGNFSKYFSSMKIYRSSDNSFSTSTDNLILTITPPGSGTSTNTVSTPVYTATYPSTNTYYFVVLDLNADYSDVLDASYYIKNPQIAYDNLNGGNPTLSVTYSGQTFNEHLAYKWLGNSSSYSTNTNWYYDVYRYYSPFGANGTPASAPPANAYVYIPSTATNSPTTTSDLTLNGLVIESGKTLTLNNASLSVSNTLSTEGGIAFTGTASNTFTISSGVSTSLGSLSIIKGAKATTVTLPNTNANLNITGTLNLQNATLATNGKLTLKSSATTTASISRLDQTNTGTIDAAITGNVIAERYVTGGSSYNTSRSNYTYRNYRLMSSPVSNNTSPVSYTLNYIATSAIVTGATGGYTSSGNPTLYLYREDFNGTSTSFTSGNFRGVNSLGTGVTVVSDATTRYLYPGTGFLFYFRGDKTNNLTAKTTAPYVAPESVVFSNTGTINQGPITYKYWVNGNSTLSYSTSYGTATSRGLNLAGNPYPSSISWTALYPNCTNVETKIWQFDPITNQYGSYVQGDPSGTNNASDVISSGEGFFVQAKNNTSSAINFTESCKVTTQNSGSSLLLGMPVTNTAPPQYLKLKLIKDTLNYDDILIGFRPTATVAYNEDQDAYDLGGSGALESLSVVSTDKINLASKWYPLPKKQQEIPLLVDATANGRFTLSLTEYKNMPAIYQVWLKDALTKDSLDIKNNPNYIFDIDRNNASTYGNGRLSLVVRQVNNYHFLGLTGEKATDGVLLKWKTENEYDYLTFTIERSTDNGKTFLPIGAVHSNGNGTYSYTDQYPTNGTYVYRIKQDDFNNDISYSKEVTVTYESGTLKDVISVYPNPTPNMLNIQVISAPASNNSFNIRIVNTSGNLIRQVTSNQKSWQGNVSDLLPGVYLIQVIDNSTQNVVGNSKFIKL